jgi:hypothetical protein
VLGFGAELSAAAIQRGMIASILPVAIVDSFRVYEVSWRNPIGFVVTVRAASLPYTS